MNATRGPRARLLPPILAILALLSASLAVTPALALPSDQYADPAFERTWNRTDKPVEDGAVQRSWVWGNLVSEGRQEPYAQSPGGERLVQYFDKSRMEINNPNIPDDGLWYVTNGLLVVEMMTGDVQKGDATFEHHQPAEVPVAGDPDDPNSPTYADLAALRNQPAATNGAALTKRLDGNGQITDDPTLANRGVTAAQRVTVPGIDHQVASVFWDYMNSSGPVWEDGALKNENLFLNPYYATGYPITEAYWVEVNVAGTPHLVLLQCFERRCLTYTEENDPAWRVEMGNVGLHYWRWLYAQPAIPQLYVAKLVGANEVPAVDTPSYGLAAFVLSDDHQTINYYLEVSDVTEATAAHIHIGAAGTNGSVVIQLYDAEGEPFSGSGVLAEGQITNDDMPEGITVEDLAELAATGGYYVNVHTTAHPSGEIRGQMEIADDLVFKADLTPDQEVADPPVDSEAVGQAALFWDNDTATLDYTVQVASIDNTTASHIHLAPPGQNGPVVAPLVTPTEETPSTGTIDTADLTGPLSGQSIYQLIYALLTDGAYVNVHSSDYPAGEIRGNVELLSPHEGDVLFYTEMFGDQEVPPVETDGSGAVAVVWHSGNYFTYTLAVADLVHVTAAHIHLAGPGVTGPVILPLYVGEAPTEGEVNGVLAQGELLPEDIAGPLAGQSCARVAYEMLAGHTYANVHTTENPSGAIRGQMAMPGDIDGLYIAQLSGDSAVPPVESDGTGVAFFYSYLDEGTGQHVLDWILVVGGIENMTMSHIHQGGPADNGPVVADLVLAPEGETIDAEGVIGAGTIDAASLQGPLAGMSVDDLLDGMNTGNAYVNVHSTIVPSGEIRGTIEPLWTQ